MLHMFEFGRAVAHSASWMKLSHDMDVHTCAHTGRVNDDDRANIAASQASASNTRSSSHGPDSEYRGKPGAQGVYPSEWRPGQQQEASHGATGSGRPESRT